MHRSVSTANLPLPAQIRRSVSTPNLQKARGSEKDLSVSDSSNTSHFGAADMILLYLVIAALITLMNLCTVFGSEIEVFFHPKGMRLQIPWFIDSLCNSNIIIALVVIGITCHIAQGVRHQICASMINTHTLKIKNLGSAGWGAPVIAAEGKDCPDLEIGADQPKITMVLPVKWGSIKTTSPLANWRHQLGTKYTNIEYIFVVESDRDGALPLIYQLQAEYKGSKHIRVVVAGLASTCTQKVHNIVHGAMASSADSTYLYFIDVNCRLYPGTLHDMIAHKRREKAFICSGLPLDIPDAKGSWFSWTIGQFRYFTVLPAHNTHGLQGVWGGAMLLSRTAFLEEGVKEMLLDGAASDDVGLWGYTNLKAKNKKLCMPLSSTFVNQVRPDMSFTEALDFLSRQTQLLWSYPEAGGFCMHQLFLWIVLGLFNSLFILDNVICVAVLLCLLVSPIALAHTYYGLVILVLLYFGAYLAHMIFLRAMLASKYQMCCRLNPTYPTIDISHLTAGNLGVSFMVFNICCLIAWLNSMLNPVLTWGGIRYTIKRGKVVRVKHPSSAPNPKPRFSQTDSARPRTRAGKAWRKLTKRCSRRLVLLMCLLVLLSGLLYVLSSIIELNLHTIGGADGDGAYVGGGDGGGYSGGSGSSGGSRGGGGGGTPSLEMPSIHAMAHGPDADPSMQHEDHLDHHEPTGNRHAIVATTLDEAGEAGDDGSEDALAPPRVYTVSVGSDYDSNSTYSSAPSNMTQSVNIASGWALNLRVPARSFTEVHWEWQLDQKDIDFAVLLLDQDEREVQVVRPKERHMAQQRVRGSFIVPDRDVGPGEQGGVLSLMWNNEYSWVRSKTVDYTLTMLHPHGDNPPLFVTTTVTINATTLARQEEPGSALSSEVHSFSSVVGDMLDCCLVSMMLLVFLTFLFAVIIWNQLGLYGVLVRRCTRTATRLPPGLAAQLSQVLPASTKRRDSKLRRG